MEVIVLVCVAVAATGGHKTSNAVILIVCPPGLSHSETEEATRELLGLIGKRRNRHVLSVPCCPAPRL